MFACAPLHFNILAVVVLDIFNCNTGRCDLICNCQGVVAINSIAFKIYYWCISVVYEDGMNRNTCQIIKMHNYHTFQRSLLHQGFLNATS